MKRKVKKVPQKRLSILSPSQIKLNKTTLARTKAIPPMPPRQLKRIQVLKSQLPKPDMRLAEFVRASWHVIEPYTPYDHNWHIDVICAHLEAATYGEIRNLIINIQPRHMKSLLVSVFWPVWTWTFLPWSQWLFLSHKQSLSLRDNLKRRRIINSPWFQKKYGHVFQLSSDQKQKSWFENSKRGHMIASGLSGAIGLGADFIVGDDILSREAAYSQVRRERANTVWDETVSTRINNPKTGVKVMIAQRLHSDDPVGHLSSLEQSGGEVYERLIIPTEYEPNKKQEPTKLGWVDPRSREGELLWPKRYGRQFIEKLKISLGSMASAAQLQQRPGVSGGNIFRAVWWNFWMPPKMNLPPVRLKLEDGTIITKEPVERPYTFEFQAQSWDMAFKEVQGSSYVVGQVWGANKQRYYLMDQRRERMDLPETLNAVRGMTIKHPEALAKLVEDRANGPAVIQSLRNEIAGFIPITPKESKESRANAVSPIVESGNVYLPHPAIAPWIFDFIEECSNFPSGVYNDQVDGLTQFLNYINKKRRKSRAINRKSIARMKTRK